MAFPVLSTLRERNSGSAGTSTDTVDGFVLYVRGKGLLVMERGCHAPVPKSISGKTCCLNIVITGRAAGPAPEPHALRHPTNFPKVAASQVPQQIP